MSHSSRQVYQSKEVITSTSNVRNANYGRNMGAHTLSSQSEMRTTAGHRQQGTSRAHIESRQGAGLQWQAMNSIVYNNGEGMEDLFRHKNILLDLLQQFEGGEKVVIEGRQKDQFNKRLMLLEHEIDGLSRRKIMFSAQDHEGGSRSLDYTGLLNQKQNQVVQLEKKIQNLEERLRRNQGRQTELENQIIFLNGQLKKKNQIIHEKERALSQQVSFSRQMASIIETISRSNQSRSVLGDLVIPSLSISDIKSSANKTLSQNRNSNLQIIKLVRQIEGSGSKGSNINGQAIIEGWIMGLPRDNHLRMKLTEGEKRVAQEKRYSDMEEKFTLAGDIYRQQLERIRKQNPNVRIQVDDEMFSILRSSGSQAIRVGDVIHVERMVEKTIEVPVQDSRTKHLIHLLASNYKKLFTKYPKLYSQMDSRLSEFFSQQLIDVMEVDELDRIVEVVKYVPQVVKVENVYAYSSEKSRKVEFHLRVLIKALIEEMEKLKVKSGIVPQIDEGIIGMIRQEIMDVVDVDDILKVYRVTPKIVEVEKIVQKIVERIVQVPKIIEVEKKVQTPYEVKKYQVVQNTVNVPLQVPKFQTLIVQKLVQVPRIQEKIVQVPRIVQKVVQVIREVPKIIEVEKVVEKPVEVDRYRQIEREIIVPVVEYKDIELIKEKIVPTERIVEKSIPVDQFIEKIVEVRVEVPKVVEVEKIIQKIVERVEYVPAPDVKNHIEIRYEPVDRIIQKVVPIVQTVQQIVEVPQIIEKIVEVHDIIEKPIQVEVIREKIVYKDRIKQVERVIEKPVVEYRTIEKQIERIIQVPLIKEIVKIERQVEEVPVFETIEKIIHKQVQVQVPKIIYQDRIKEVDRVVNHFIKEPEVIHIYEDKIIPVQKVIERIKNVPTIVEKVIEKMVEVPKVVEVQKIVERIVVVPRVIEKIVQVPQIVEKIVQRIQVVNQVVEIERVVNVPVIQEKVVEVEIPRNVYIEVQKPVEVVREMCVRDQTFKQSVKVQQIYNDRVAVQTHQVPRTLEVEKIVTNIVEQPKIIQINRDIIVPVEIQIPVDRIVQKMIPIHNVHRQIEQVDKIREKVVPLRQQEIKVIEVDRKVDNIIIEERVKEVQRIVPYMQDRIVEVEKLREKIVPVQRVIQEIRQVQQVVEKVVDRVSEIPRVYEVEKLVQKRVDVPKIIEVEKIVPEIVRVNQYIERIVQKIIEVPVLIQQLKQIQVEKEKIVRISTQDTKVMQIDRTIEKQVIVERLKQVTNNIHLVQQTLQIVDRIIDRQLDPVLLTQERVLEVPQIIEKIVEKIVIMPQIVEVLKYVHQISQKQTLGMAVGAQIGIEQRRYKDMGSSLKSQLTVILTELRSQKSSSHIRVQIQMIQKFLSEFEHFLLFPRIQQIIQKEEVERVVEKDRPVLVPVESESHLRQELSKTILIEKLLNQLKEVKRVHPDYRYSLDDDISLIFLSELGMSSKHINEGNSRQMEEFSHSVQRRFSEMGGWTQDHQMMLNSFLQERFLMANVVKNSNQTIKKTQAISEKRLSQLRKTKEQRDAMAMSLKSLQQMLPSIITITEKERSTGISTHLNSIMTNINTMLVGEFFKGEPTKRLDELVIDVRVKSMIREKDDLIIELKNRLRQMSTSGTKSSTSGHDSAYYQSRIREISMQLSRIQSTHSNCDREKHRLNQQIERLILRISQLEEELKGRIVSPKHSINTRNSITTPPYEKRGIDKEKLQVSRRSDKSESDSSSYGANYLNYGNNEEGHEQKIYRSSYQTGSIDGGSRGEGVTANYFKQGQRQIGGGSAVTTEQRIIKRQVHQQIQYGGTQNTMSGSAVGGQIDSKHYMLGTESRSKGQIESGSYKRMQQSSVSSSGGQGNITTGKTNESYYESKYQRK